MSLSLNKAISESLWLGREDKNHLNHHLLGASPLGAVHDLALSSMQAAVSATQRFCQDVYGDNPTVQINRDLVDRWCVNSVFPVGWSMPPLWDDLAKDYRTIDGWIRLHTNAPHHRKVAERVLSGVTCYDEAKEAIACLKAFDLETAIVKAGGCAAQLRTRDRWHEHPQGQAVMKEPIVAWSDIGEAQSTWHKARMEKPLAGLKVVDLTRVIAGPVATRFLAGLGADVLRIDPSFWTEHGKEIDLTIGKRCAELDLRMEQDRNKLRELLKSADIFVHGYRKDALANLGFSRDALTSINPRLISISLNAYGATGEWQNRRGFDSLVQRSSGLAVADERRVYELPYQVLDHATGYLMAASAIEALRFLLLEHKVMSAHLSLARQAALLSDMKPDTKQLYRHQFGKDSGQEAYLDRCTHEHTGWGKALRLPNPFDIEGVNYGWHYPAQQLRSSLPHWN